jgi:hypothetical protein
MKRFKLLLVALATVSFTAFYACGGENDEETTDSTKVEEVIEEPEVIEETTPDSTEMATPDSTMTEEETPENTEGE